MSHKKLETFKRTEFGPMSTGHTIETTSCKNCFKLQQENSELQRALDKARAMLDRWEDEHIADIKKQLADAKAQIADYEAALKTLKDKWDLSPEAKTSVSYGIVNEALNKWRSK